jgi:cytochrome c-type biogenesis protein CcmH/NrfG
VKERPILGWGQENYAIVFDKYYDPRMYAQEPWFDRVHDIVMDWLIAGGFLGLLSYLSIFGATLWALWKRASVFTAAEKSIFTGLLAGYFFHNLTVFDNVTSYILFGFVLAYITWRESTAAPLLFERRIMPQGALPFVAAVCAVVLWGAAWFTNASALSQNRTLLLAVSPQQSGVLTNLSLFKQAIAYGSYGTQEAREQLAQGATQIASTQGVDLSVKQQFFDSAVSEMMLQAQASPLDARFPLFLGILEYSFGDSRDAAAAFEKAHELSPSKQTILFQIALNQQAGGDTAGSLATFKQAYDLEPEDNDALLYYAAEAIRAGQDSLANQLLAPLIPTGDAADPRITAAYADRGAYAKIVQIFLAHVKAQPQDVQGYFTLAAAYLGAGDSADAIATLQAAEKISPAAATQAESLIQQIKNGTAKVQ